MLSVSSSRISNIELVWGENSGEGVGNSGVLVKGKADQTLLMMEWLKSFEMQG